MADRLIDRTLRAFSDDLSADSPVPGGGSAAAYAGAMGAALAAMVSRIASKKTDSPDQAGFIEEMDGLRADFLRLVDEDSAAYARVAAALKLPRKTEEEKAARQERLQTSLIAASAVPLEVAKTSRRLLDACARGIESPSPMTASDIGVGAPLGEASPRSRWVPIRRRIPMSSASYRAGRGSGSPSRMLRSRATRPSASSSPRSNERAATRRRMACFCSRRFPASSTRRTSSITSRVRRTSKA